MALTKIDDRGLTTPIDLLDNEKIRFGTGNDLELYHDPSNGSFIKNGAGSNLLISANGSGCHVYIQGKDGEDSIIAERDGAVKLYYDNVKKFETYSGGIRTFDHISCGGSVVVADSNKFIAGDGDDLQIYHNGSDSYIDSSTGNLALRTTNAGHISIKTNNEYGIFCAANAAVDLYYDHSKKLETTSTGAKVTGGLDVRDTSTTAYPFSSADSGAYSYTPYAHELNLRNNTTGTDDGFAGIHFHAGERSAGGRQGTARISALYTGEYKADLVFATRNVSFAERMRITADGKLGLNIAAPTKSLDIATSASADGIRIKSTGSTYNDINFDANRSAANTHIARIISHWDGTAISYISFDTGNAAGSGKNKGYMRFWTADGSGNFERLRIHSDGKVELQTGDLKLADGKGIDFSSTSGTGTSELLDDYERGTWGSVAQGGATCNFNDNWYQKVGRKVTCNVRLNGFGGTGNTDTFKLNLPFAGTNEACVGSLQADTFNVESDWVQVSPYAYGAYVSLLATRDNVGWESIKGNRFANSSIIMTFTYHSAS